MNRQETDFLLFAEEYPVELSDSEVRRFHNMLNTHHWTIIRSGLSDFREFVESEIAFRMEAMMDLFREPIRSSIFVNIDEYSNLEEDDEAVEEIQETMIDFLEQIAQVIHKRYLSADRSTLDAFREFDEHRYVILKLLYYYLILLRRLRQNAAAPAA